MTTAPATIWVRFQHEGLHCWPGATPRRRYLANPHRHMFHVCISTNVGHDDREIEFHDLRAEAESMFAALGDRGDFGSQSCEMLARGLAQQLVARYSRAIAVEVSEDGEFGATISAAPSRAA